MSGLLITQRGAIRISKAELMQIEPPACTATWKPVAHGVLINSLIHVLSNRGLAVRKEEYAVQNQGHILFGVLDLNWGETAEYYAALGLRTSNNKHFAIQIAIGARVVVCDNLLMSGELIALRRKHTAGLQLMDELTHGVRKYERGYDQLQGGIERLKAIRLHTIETKEILYNIFAQKVMPIKLFPQVVRVLSLHVSERKTLTQWTLHNMCTTALKRLKPSVAFEANVKLGKFFTLGGPGTPRSAQPIAPPIVTGFSSSESGKETALTPAA